MIAKGLQRALLFSATAILAGAPLYACPPGAEASCPCLTAEQALASLKALDAEFSYAYVGSSNLQMLSDQEFIRESIGNGAARVMLSQIAAQKSQSEDIRQFGQKMVEDHTWLGDQIIKKVAKLIGVTDTTTGISRENKKLADHLQSLSGPQFDEEYIRLMLKDQQQDLKRFSNEERLTQDPSVKIAADQGVNVTTQDLLLVERIAENHSTAVAGNHAPAVAPNHAAVVAQNQTPVIGTR
ncbi:MAG TPA: DUF4142 domain-containing protein [Acidobacteriaceae bacterium]|jgi:putative membrane protein|nr:DUF4142 domain-containing protein [Acidobacteriaceae bacterium]